MRHQQLVVFLFLSALGLDVVATRAAAPGVAGPVAVSPGSSTGTRIADACPTFSWGAVDGARSYELVAYRLPEQGAEARAVLRELVPGSALAWTPSLDRCLERGGLYAWSVRASTGNETSEWSPAILFQIVQAPTDAEVEAALSVLRRHLETGRESTFSSGVTVGAESELDPGPQGVASRSEAVDPEPLAERPETGLQGASPGFPPAARTLARWPPGRSRRC